MEFPILLHAACSAHLVEMAALTRAERCKQSLDALSVVKSA